MFLGHYIKEVRVIHEDSQETLAYKLGVKRQAISRWERDESLPSLHHIVQLVELYQLDLHDIMRHVKCSLKRKETNYGRNFR